MRPSALTSSACTAVPFGTDKETDIIEASFASTLLILPSLFQSPQSPHCNAETPAA